MHLTEVRPFHGEQHAPFFWSGGQPAALLVHGFPGTPAELRTLGAILHREGWTVQGVLLPGFGPDIWTLAERCYTEWVDAVRESLAALQREHSPVLIVGFSMGGAVALHAAADLRPDALVLIAPFWQFGALWQHVAWPAVRLVVRRFRPFRYTSLEDPRVRRRLASLLPEVDLDDPVTQRALHKLSVPTTVLDQVHRVGRCAFRLAPKASLRTLVIQGSGDQIVRPQQTRRLLCRLPGPLEYHEVDGGHDIIDPHHPAWTDVERIVLDFANRTVSPRPVRAAKQSR